MTWKEFILSDSASHRTWRHGSFLALMGLVFFLQSVIPGRNIYLSAFFSLCCFFPTCIFSVYACLQYLLPYLLQQRKYGRFLVAFIMLGIICLFFNYNAAGLFIWLARDLGTIKHIPSPQLELGFVNTSHALIIGGIALGIKFGKNWYLRSRGNMALTKQKILTELRLEKARLYPKFLYQSLNNLRSGIGSGSDNASSLVLRISDLLSYILYEQNEKWVPLEKELEMIRHLIEVKRSGRSSGCDIQLSITGQPARKFIVPMTLFPLLEKCLELAEDTKNAYPELSTDIRIGNNDLQMTQLIRNIPGEESDNYWQSAFSGLGQRLDAIYPGGCSLDVKAGQQILIIGLGVALQTDADQARSNQSSTNNGIYATA